jgi:hypothetical protein
LHLLFWHSNHITRKIPDSFCLDHIVRLFGGFSLLAIAVIASSVIGILVIDTVRKVFVGALISGGGIREPRHDVSHDQAPLERHIPAERGRRNETGAESIDRDLWTGIG